MLLHVDGVFCGVVLVLRVMGECFHWSQVVSIWQCWMTGPGEILCAAMGGDGKVKFHFSFFEHVDRAVDPVG